MVRWWFRWARSALLAVREIGTIPPKAPAEPEEPQRAEPQRAEPQRVASGRAVAIPGWAARRPFL